MYGIYPKPWGFEVSLSRGRTRHLKLFGIAEWGNAQEALCQARAWRDTIVKSIPPAKRRTRAEKVRANNKTGTPGVTQLLRVDGSVQAWRAHTYVGPGEILRAYFSVNVHGESAYTLAIEARAKQLKRMSGLTKPHPAEELVRTRKEKQPTSPVARKKSKTKIVRRDNSSGVSGVQFKVGQRDHPGYWMAITGSRGERSVSKAFSIKTLGFEKAKELAIAERERQLAQKKKARATN